MLLSNALKKAETTGQRLTRKQWQELDEALRMAEEASKFNDLV